MGTVQSHHIDPPSACNSVLNNADILELIAGHLPRADIATSRLTNRTFNASFSKHLFRHLRVRFSSWYVDRLKYISQHETFASGVRELIFDTATYANVESMRPLVEKALKTLDPVVQHTIACDELMMRLGIAAEGEERLALNVAEFLPLTNALGRLIGCRKLTITTWSGPGEHMLEEASFTGSNNRLPPPLATLKPGNEACIFQTPACMTLLPDVANSHCQFREIFIFQSDRSILGPGKNMFELPGMMITIPPGNCRHLVENPSSQLRTLALQYQLNHMDAYRLFWAAVQPLSMRSLWQGAADLHELDLEIRMRVPFPESRTQDTCYLPLTDIFGGMVFRNLTVLTLRSMWLKTAELANFLYEHIRTLKHITFRDVNLGDADLDLKPYPDEKLWLISIRSLGRRAAGSHLDLQSWSEIVTVCQSMDSLRGLAISGASINSTWAALTEEEITDLIELGMGGRANDLAIPHWSAIWK